MGEQQQILLPLEVLLKLRIAFLEREVQQLQTQIMAAATEQRHSQQVYAILQAYRIWLPVPLSECTFDADLGCLSYTEPAAHVPDPPA